jgi:Putative peptidoglycan binding domain
MTAFDPADSAEMPASDAQAGRTCFIQPPFSVAEIAAGGVAVVAVVLVASVGLPASQPPAPSPPPAPVAVASAPVPVPTASTSVSAASATVPAEPAIVPAEPAASAALPAVSPPVPVAPPPSPSIPKIQWRLETTGAVDQAPSESAPPDARWRPVDPGAAARSNPSEPTVAATAPARETAAVTTQPPDTALNPQNPSDAIWVQARLGDLGYFSASRTGFWGPASRSALRDFKSLNGLQEDDQWDRETEQRLSSREVVPAAKTFLGGWAEDINQCRNDHGAPIVISSRAARTTGGGCDFRSVKREAAARWRVQAVCSAGRNSWNANVDLRLDAPKLIWSSEHGIATYVRCAKPALDSPIHRQASRGTEFERALRDFANRISIWSGHP